MSDKPENRNHRLQFTFANLMVWLTLIAIIFAEMTWLSPTIVISLWLIAGLTWCAVKLFA